MKIIKKTNTKIKGSVSIFLSLILLPTYIFGIISTDLFKIYSLKSLLNSSHEIFISSSLAHYDDDLYDRFNLLAITDSEKELNDKAVKYFVNTIENSNIYNKGDNFSEEFPQYFNISPERFKKPNNILNPLVKEANISFIKDSSLLNTDILEKQVVSYMKYRGPITIGKNFLSFVKIMEKGNKQSKTISSKLKYEKELSKIDKLVIQIKENSIAYEDNLENINAVQDIYMKNQENLLIDALGFKEKDKELDKKINSISYDISEKELDNERKIYLEERHKELIKKQNLNKAKLEKKIRDYNNNFKDIEELYYLYDMNIAYIQAGIEKTRSRFNELEKLKEKWEKEIDNLEDGEMKDNFILDFKNSAKKFNPQQLFIFSDLVDEEKIVMDKNTSAFNKLKEYDLELINISDKKLDDLLSKGFNTSRINIEMINLSSFKGDKFFDYLYNDKKQKNISRKEKSEAKKKRKQLKKTNKSNKTEKPPKDSLYNYMDKEKAKSILENNPLFSSLDNSLDINLAHNNDKNIAAMINHFDSVEDIEIKKDKNILSELLITEYIADKFSNKIYSKDKNKFISQQEYILFGEESLDKNISKLNNWIFTMRFALNSGYAFTNSTLRKESLTLATALAGWTGLGIPIVQNVLLGSLAFGESLIDVSELNKGEQSSIYKNKDSWRLSFTNQSKNIGKKVVDLAIGASKNIYEKIEDFTIEFIDDIDKELDNFIEDTLRGVSENITSSIVVPIQEKIINLVEKDSDKEESLIEINKLIDEINFQISSEGVSNSKEKIKVLEKVRDMEISNIMKLTSDLQNGNSSLQDMDKYFSETIENFEKEIIKSKDKLSKEFKQSVKGIYERVGKNKKDDLKNEIDKFLEKINGGEIDKNQNSLTAFTLNYEDYMKIITFIKLNGPEKENILRRMALLIDSELGEDFDIRQTTTNFNYYTEVLVKTRFLHYFNQKYDSEYIVRKKTRRSY